MVLGSAIATNSCRIQRFLVAKTKLENELNNDLKGQGDRQTGRSPCGFMVGTLPFNYRQEHGIGIDDFRHGHGNGLCIGKRAI